MIKYCFLIISVLAGVGLKAQVKSTPKSEPIDSAIIKAKADTSKAWMFKGTFVDSTSKRKHVQTPIFGSYKTNIIAGSIVMPVGLCGIAGGIVYRFYGKTNVIQNAVGLSVLSGGITVVGAVLLGTGLRTQVLKNQSTSMNIGILDSGEAGMLVQF